MPSTMAHRNGPLLWRTLPHMRCDVITGRRDGNLRHHEAAGSPR